MLYQNLLNNGWLYSPFIFLACHHRVFLSSIKGGWLSQVLVIGIFRSRCTVPSIYIILSIHTIHIYFVMICIFLFFLMENTFVVTGRNNLSWQNLPEWLMFLSKFNEKSSNCIIFEIKIHLLISWGIMMIIQKCNVPRQKGIMLWRINNKKYKLMNLFYYYLLKTLISK